MRLAVAIVALMMVSGCASEYTLQTKKAMESKQAAYKACIEKSQKSQKKCLKLKNEYESSKDNYNLSVSNDEKKFSAGLQAFADGMQEYRETKPQAIMNDSMIHGGYGAFGSPVSYSEAVYIAEINKARRAGQDTTALRYELQNAENQRLIKEQNRKLDEINNRLISERYGLVP
jgi:hypothetical protein